MVYSTDNWAPKVVPNKVSRNTSDGIIRIRRESKKRAGRVVCVVEGLPSEQIKTTCKELKSKCGTGGTVKDGLVGFRVITVIKSANYSSPKGWPSSYLAASPGG